MAKYGSLGAYPNGRGSPKIELVFEKVERIIEGKLAKTAARPQWWANETDPGTRQVQLARCGP